MKRYIILIIPCSGKVGQLISAALMSAIKSGDRQIQWRNKFPNKDNILSYEPREIRILLKGHKTWLDSSRLQPYVTIYRVLGEEKCGGIPA
jgi:hypothetical protein